ncbi:hypothetical protein ACLRDC_06650 [Gluconacetobacter sacchari]|uniref:Uncharacterized protein n=2 Tax=Gluconacetobacter sacchari TaxID=92759 RepID=A0A7W4IGD4_9PROT|nr:hypothetical protein [Gluconacetobacter sacchari]MBB2162408.1 hypothetical protein [Gluconacetobacter sacchari]GBQ22927.1 hypothetical protein AA12717_1333 [Gluconacetobacter sacchari DSM 12717]
MPRFYALAAALLALSATRAHAASPFTGQWAAMGLSPVVVGAPDAHGQVPVTLPDELRSYAPHQVTLAPHGKDALQSPGHDPLVTLHLVSANSADLTIKGTRPGQTVTLPLSRDD